MSNFDAIALIAPTATGKTNLALQLAKIYPIEIISVDSVLIYKGMNIGSAKPNQDELLAVTHHLIDIISPLESYSVKSFIDDVIILIEQIKSRGKIPFLVGGTMMYFNGLFNGISELPQASIDIRSKLEQDANKYGVGVLHKKLELLDPISYNKINPQDSQRIIRALEVYYMEGKPISLLQQQCKMHLAEHIKFLKLAIMPSNRALLHQRINNRLDYMINLGLIDEVKKLKEIYSDLTDRCTSIKSVGYFQVWQYIHQKISFDDMVEKAKASSRQLAKRQITWMRSMYFDVVLDDVNLDQQKLLDLIIKSLDDNL